MNPPGKAGKKYVYGPGVKPQPTPGEGGQPSSGATPGAAEEEKKKTIISEDEARKSKALTVKACDLKVVSNAVRHWTLRYEGTWADPPKSILRRGREFSLVLTFNRPFRTGEDDVIFEVSAVEDDNKPRKNLRARFKVEEEEVAGGEEGKGGTKDPNDWWGEREKGARGEEMQCRVSIPGECAVGFWHLQVHTLQRHTNDVYVYVLPRPLIVLFNPWSEGDQTHFTEDKEQLEEYVLNAEGTVFMGTPDHVRSRRWHYGQFEDGVVEMSLWLLKKAFQGKMTRDMGDPVLVSRALSRIMNSSDDQGVLLGNWSQDYSGGRSPLSWSSSLPILRQFQETEEPVKFGQCWVFSHTLTTVCRALGLPCRSVTNFASAHDTDTTCTIDVFLDLNGDIMENMGEDSIWNFHVWNEVWMLRPDLQDAFYKQGYDGWQVVDATPQERSLGMMQCGPCPVKAVKRGEVSVGYDTVFVFSEVNAELVHWAQSTPGQFDSTSYVSKSKVGQKISTLAPKCLVADEVPGDKSIHRLDLTDTYKFPEGSEEERQSVKRAVRYCRYGSKLFNQCSDLQVTLEDNPDMEVGKEVQMTSKVTNVSGQDREVQVSLVARAAPYWDHTKNSRLLAKEQLPSRTIKAGASETFQLKVKPERYMWACSGCDWTIHGFACARDISANMPYTAQQPYALNMPTLLVQGPASAKSGEVVTVVATMTNPLHVPLTLCSFLLDGNLTLSPDDPGTWTTKYGAHFLDCGKDYEVGPYKEVKLTVRLMGEWKGEEDKEDKTTAIAFDSLELGIIMASYDLKKAA